MKQTSIMSVHIGRRLIYFLSVVGNFFLVLSVVSNIFRPLSLVGLPHSHPLFIQTTEYLRNRLNEEFVLTQGNISALMI